MMVKQVFDESGLPINESESRDLVVDTTESQVEEHQLAHRPSMWDPNSFALIQRYAKAYNSSSLVPPHFQGVNGIGNAVIACNMAFRLNADPLMVMQSLYVVHGKPSWSAAFLIATFNSCGRYEPIEYQEAGEGEDRELWAQATVRRTGITIAGPRVSIKMARAEGWFDKKGSKWQTMPELMLRYRAATFLIRTVAPELSLGLYTVDEREDIGS